MIGADMTRRRRWTMIAAVAALVVAAGGVGVALAATGGGSSGLTATFQKSSDWGTGYEATYTISNPGSTAVTGWRVEFTLPSTATLGSVWEAKVTSSGGRNIATNASYNASGSPGASTSFGFIVTGSGAPLSCTVNGAPCAGGTATGTATTTASATRTSATPQAPASSSAKPGATATTATPAPTGTGVTPVAAVAPYVDMGAWPTPNLTTVMSSGGLSAFTLGFVTGAGCRASWFGAYDPRTAWGKDQIDAVRAKGGTVKVSFGGASGVELAQGCGDVTSLETEYQAVVDAYGLTAIDLDIEGAAAAEPASIERRSKALAQLQQTAAGPAGVASPCRSCPRG